MYTPVYTYIPVYTYTFSLSVQVCIHIPSLCVQVCIHIPSLSVQVCIPIPSLSLYRCASRCQVREAYRPISRPRRRASTICLERPSKQRLPKSISIRYSCGEYLYSVYICVNCNANSCF